MSVNHLESWSDPLGSNRQPTDYESNFGASGGVKGLIPLTRGVERRCGVSASTGTETGTVHQAWNTSTASDCPPGGGGICCHILSYRKHTAPVAQVSNLPVPSQRNSARISLSRSAECVRLTLSRWSAAGARPLSRVWASRRDRSSCAAFRSRDRGRENFFMSAETDTSYSR